jgi:YVTN family beta-propeller protein
MSFHRTRIATALAIVALAGTAGARAGSTWTVLDRWTVGGAGGWDYLTFDSPGNRLFMSRATRVDVLDTRSGKIIGTIPDTEGVHGIALAGNLHRGFTSNGKSDSVTAFDLDSLNIIKRAPVSGHNPDAILYEPAGKHVFTFNGRSKDVTVLDADTLAIVRTLPVPNKPEFAVDGGNGEIYVNIESDPGQMVVIDSRELTVKAAWPLPGCASPSGLAIDRSRHRLFSVCDGKVMAVTDATNGRQVAKLKIGESPDAAAFDARRGLVFSSNGDGTLTVIRRPGVDHYIVAGSIPTMKGARTMALDEAGGKIYLVSADFDPAPAATAAQPHPRPIPKPDTFTVLVVSDR